jgi:hypothetical protein
MTKFINTTLSIILLFISSVIAKTEGDMSVNKQTNKAPIMFATFAETEEQVDHAVIFAESIRQFGGAVKEAPIYLYVGDYSDIDIDQTRERLQFLNVMVQTSTAPNDALWFYYAGKVYAAAVAEKKAEKRGSVLVWMDDDTIVLDEPSELLLRPEISFGYRPVMHNRSGTLYGTKPNVFWSRIYEKLKVDYKNHFAMTTPADNQKIYAYFNAGLLVVRPNKGILQRWLNAFETLYKDSALAKMCRENVEYRIFLHQTALVGAVMNSLERDEMIELSDRYNYPLFFEQMFDASQQFGSIEGIKTLRYDIYFRNPDPEWYKKLKGPADKIDWLKKRLPK